MRFTLVGDSCLELEYVVDVETSGIPLFPPSCSSLASTIAWISSLFRMLSSSLYLSVSSGGIPILKCSSRVVWEVTINSKLTKGSCARFP